MFSLNILFNVNLNFPISNLEKLWKEKYVFDYNNNYRQCMYNVHNYLKRKKLLLLYLYIPTMYIVHCRYIYNNNIFFLLR